MENPSERRRCRFDVEVTARPSTVGGLAWASGATLESHVDDVQEMQRDVQVKRHLNGIRSVKKYC